MENLVSFYYLGEHRPVRYLQTEKVKSGVFCDVYEFTGQNAYDLAVVRVAPNHSTPVQRIELEGSKTVEGILDGYGSFFAAGASRTSLTFGTPKVHTLSSGDIMQWEAGDDGLTFFEICHPPYEDGRFTNLTD